MAGKNVNLNDIYKLPDVEFQKHFAQWVEEDGVARALQAKLRKDLIETFNKTHLGRRIYSQYSRTNRMILSPLILALNTLVAEFLYAQNCHFSLSVFSTEVPYRNTLPDFEEQTRFRFTKSDLFEIFEAISANDLSTEFRDKIILNYLSKSQNDFPSLLYLIFKHIFKFILPRPPIQEPPYQQSRQSDCDKSESEKEKSARKPSSLNAFYENHMRYLNRYLIILSRKVKEMSINLEQLQRREEATTRTQRKSTPRNHKIEILNRSLEKISENLRTLSYSKRKNRNISQIIKAVDKLAQQMEKCTENFEKLSRNWHEKSTAFERGSDGDIEKSYCDWIKEMNWSRNGKKFVGKIEASLRKTLQEEKEKLTKAFELKLENQKILLKLKCKQKLLQYLENRQHVEVSMEKTDEMKTLIEQKLNELSKKHDALLQKIDREGRAIQKQTDSINDRHRLEEKSVGNETSAHVEDRPQASSKEIAPEKVKTKTEKSTKKPQMEDIARNIADQENNIDRIVSGVRFHSRPASQFPIPTKTYRFRLRLQELESERLDRELLDYFERREYDKSLMGDDAESIWKNYTARKAALYQDVNEPFFSFGRQEPRANRDLKPNRFAHFRNEAVMYPSSDERSSSEPNQSSISLGDYPELQRRYSRQLKKTRQRNCSERDCDRKGTIKAMVDTATSPFQAARESNLAKASDDKVIAATSGQDSGRSESPSLSELCLKDITLEGIVLSDTNSSQRSDSLARLVSLDLRVPNLSLRHSDGTRELGQVGDTSSTSFHLGTGTGKQNSSDGGFWN